MIMIIHPRLAGAQLLLQLLQPWTPLLPRRGPLLSRTTCWAWL